MDNRIKKIILGILIVIVLSSLTQPVDASTNLYNMSSFTLDIYNMTGVPTDPADSELSYAETASLTAINFSDDSRWTTDGATADGEYDTQVFIFNATETISKITKLNLTWEGYGETQANYYTNISFYNWTSAKWVNLNYTDFTSADEINISVNVSDGIVDYVNNTTTQVAVMVTTLKYFSAEPEYTLVYDEDSDSQECGPGDWCGGACANVYDGDWGTFAQDGLLGGRGCGASTTGSSVNVNYTTPANANPDSLWQIKAGGGTFQNFSINDSHCWSESEIQFSMFSFWRVDGCESIWSCYNGSGQWIILLHLNGMGTEFELYEEGMYWNTTNSPFVYIYKNSKYDYISDFIPKAISKEKEYTSFVDITSTEIINGKIKLKITEELDETAYIDRIYVIVDNSNIVELESIDKADINLLRYSDDEYLTLNKGDEYYLKFDAPDTYDMLEFAAEGYYTEISTEPGYSAEEEQAIIGFFELKEDEQKSLIIFILIILILPFILFVGYKNKKIKQKINSCAKLISKIENIRVPIILWIFSLLSIIYLRGIGEIFIEKPQKIYPTSWNLEIILFWIAVYISIILLFKAITKEKITRISKVVVAFAPFTFLPVIIDHIVSFGNGFHMPYVNGNLTSLIYNFLTFYNFGLQTATIGIKFEIIGACILIMLYILAKTKSVLKAFIGIISMYTLTYIYMSPTAIYRLIFDLSTFQLQADLYIIMIRNWVVIIPILLIILFAIYHKEEPRILKPKHKTKRKIQDKSSLNIQQIKILLSNIRPFRSIHYILLVFIGVYLGAKGFANIPWFESILLFVSVFLAWEFAVIVNDIFDINIDKLSNKKRPLLTNKISVKSYSIIGGLLFIVSLILAHIVSYTALLLIITFILLYSFIYSAPPFRFRKFFLIPNIIIGLCSLTAVFLGFSLFADPAAEFPKNISLLIFIVFTIASTIKDIKDYKGDKREKIRTIPTIFGLNRGKKIIGILIAISFVIVPILYPVKNLLIFAIPFAIVGYLFVVKKNEKWIFILEFIFISIILILGAVGGVSYTGNQHQDIITFDVSDELTIGSVNIDLPHRSLYGNFVQLEIDSDLNTPEVQNWTFELNSSIYDGDTYNKYNYVTSGGLVRMNVSVSDANTFYGNFTVTENDTIVSNWTAATSGSEMYNISDCESSGNFTVNWTAAIDSLGNENQTGIEVNGSHYWICDVDTPTVDNMSANETSVLTGDIVCINASITDLWGIPDRMFAEVSYTNGTVRNESMTDDGTHPSCDDTANDGWYGVLVNVSDSAGTFTFNFTFGNDTADNRYSKEDTKQDVTVTDPADNDAPNVRNYTFELNASVYDGDTYNKYNYWPSGSIARMNVTVTDASTVAGVNFTVTDVKNSPASPSNKTGTSGAGDEWYYAEACSASGNFSVNWVAAIDDGGYENQTGIEINGSHYWICDIDTPTVDNMSANETDVLTGDIVCINASISDAWGIPDRMFAEVSYTNGTVRNESMLDDGNHPSCDDAADDGWYGALVNVSDSAGIFAYNFTFGNDTADNRYSKEDTTQTVTVTVPDYDEPNVRNYTFELNASVYDGDTYNKYNYWPSGSLVRMNITVDDDISTVSGVNFTITDVKNPSAPSNYTGKNDVADEWYNISDCESSGNFTINWTAGIDNSGNENQTGIEINGSHYWICDVDTPVIGNMSANETSILKDSTICINVSVTDVWGIIDDVVGTVTYPDNSVSNLTLTDTGGGAYCGNTENDGYYGVDLNVGSTVGLLTFNFSYSNDTAGNLGINESVEAEVNVSITTTPPAAKVIIGKGEDAYEVQIDDALNIYGIINNQNVTTQLTKTWHHVVMTYNGTDQNLYVDKEIVDTKPLTGAITLSENDLMIGENITGALDEVRIYSRALSEEEINASYNNSEYRLYHNFTNLSDQTYTYSGYAIDTSGNLNYSTRTVTVDSGAVSAGLSLSDTLATNIAWTIVEVPAINDSAGGNNGEGVTQYNLQVSASGTTADVYVKADGDLDTGSVTLGLDNETFAFNLTDDTVPNTTVYALTTSFTDNKIAEGLNDNDYVYFKFFLSAPAAQEPGTYTNTVEFKVVPNGEAP